MKIAFFLDIPNGLGGAGNLLLQQAILMSELHDVMVIIPTDNEGNYNIEYANRCKKNKMEFLCLRYNTTFNFSSIDFTESMKNVKYIEEFGTEEEKEQLEKFMTHDKNLGISSRVFRDISFASVGVAVAGLGVVLAAERKQKKEFNEELEETRKAMGELLRSLDNDPFPDYTENDTTTDESEKE